MGRFVAESMVFSILSPAEKLPRTPCSGPNNATSCTSFASKRMSSVALSFESTPVGLVISPTRLPLRMLKLFSRKTSIPSFIFGVWEKQKPEMRSKKQDMKRFNVVSSFVV